MRSPTLFRVLGGAALFALGILVGYFLHPEPNYQLPVVSRPAPEFIIPPRAPASQGPTSSALSKPKALFDDGNYLAARDFLEALLKTDVGNEEAKELLNKTKRQLNKLAKEAYTHGFIMESMNRREEAKVYWERGLRYVKSGDPYYEKLTSKLKDNPTK